MLSLVIFLLHYMYYSGVATMKVVSVRVDEELKRRMKRLSHINWSEVIRQSIAEKVREEERRRRRVDPELLLEAAELTDEVRRPSPGWRSTEEIRKWRESRK